MSSIQDKFDEVGRKFPSGGEVNRVPTASNDLNNLLSKEEDNIKGVPLGRFMSMFGPEGVGKSTVSLELCEAFCDEGLGAVYIDSEEGLTKEFVDDIGLDEHFNKLFTYHRHVNDYDQLEEILQEYLEVSQDLGLIVIDSLKSINAPVDIEDGEKVSEGRVGHEAQFDSQILGGYKTHFAKGNVTLLFIEQMRTNINMNGYGQTRDEISAGHAVKYYSDIMMKMRQKKKYRDDDNNIVSADIEFQTIKNKTAPVGSCVVPIKYSKGFDATLLIMDRLNKSRDEIDWYEQNGAWYSVFDPETGEEIFKGQGQSELEKWIEDNQDKVIDLLEQEGFVE